MALKFTRPQPPPLALIHDVFHGSSQPVRQFPFQLETGGNGADPPTIIFRDGGILLRIPADRQVKLNGQPADSGDLTPPSCSSLVVDDRLLLAFLGPEAVTMAKGVSFDQWFIVDQATGTKHGPGDVQLLLGNLLGWDRDTVDQCIVYPDGSPTAFHATDFLDAGSRMFEPVPPAPGPGTAASDSPLFEPEAEQVLEEMVADHGDLQCPVCWLHFDHGDVMHIAVHGSLQGDPLLGEEHMQRFHASRFNDRGQALDAKGMPTSDVACPHCRRKLPPGFFDSPNHIFSIVGAPSSGKSYFLSVLVKQLQGALYKHFGLVFRDADPSGNALLNQMKAKLFSSSSPQEAALIKTQLQGEMYEQLPRMGRTVALPKPFIFQVTHRDLGDERFSMVFYDNAGEHFEPNRDSIDSPGAQHIASANGILFLFDPLHHEGFRRRLDPDADPQLDAEAYANVGHDQQDVILTETDVRIKQLLAMSSRARLNTPLAFMIGKFDAWRHLPGAGEFPSPLRDGRLDHDVLDDNSRKLRGFLLDIDPAIVANAEAISSEVRFFPVSALGSAPVRFKDESGDTRIGPDPARINPMLVEDPVVWILHHLHPNLIPGR